MAAAQGRTADVPRLAQNLTSKFGMDARNQEVGNLMRLQNGNEGLQTAAAGITGKIGDLQAQKLQGILQQLGVMGTQSGILPDHSGSQQSQNSLLQAMMLMQLLGKR
jgi:hypothetical protein